MTHVALRLNVLEICAAALVGVQLVFGAEPTSTGPQTEMRFPPLQVPAGFKATLFACDPLIEYPSVISVGPRPGAIFVAVDYMTGLGTEIVRRSEVRLVEDTDGDGYADKATVFAAGFNSIQGIAWHDGALFVMHAPLLTMLRDTQATGPADVRNDLLTGLGLTPEDNPVRLHCANGVTVGHDGWMYLALGDHGCDVRRPEGDRLVLEGGGILRCRPDGRDLHVFATGLRNIYDVVLDAELNVFVRDNENDGGDYKIRVCHSFFGANHGYPYLYYQRPDEALPPLADLGLGSTAGGVCYLERQFPAEYRGNLFFCEWGKSVVRYQPRESGSSFAPLTETEFATGAANDPYGFKPTDVIVQRDGTLMVSDWADGQRPKRGRGRIYNIAYVGEGATAQSQSPANDISKANSEELLAALDSKSYAQRCEAQAAVQRQNLGGLKFLSDALMGNRLGVRGRLHAVWILAHEGGLTSIEQLYALAASDPEPAVRIQAVRALADLADSVLAQHRLDAGPALPDVAARLAALGKSQGRRVVLEVVIALGRLRWSGTTDWLRENLGQPDPALAHAAMQALRRTANWPVIVKLFDGPDGDALRTIALRAVAQQYEPVVIDALIERLRREKEASRRCEYADLLTRVWQKPGSWVYWGYRPPPRPANTVAWERSEAIAEALDLVLADPDVAQRLAVLKRMQTERIPVRLATLGRWLADEREPERVSAILASLADQPAIEVRNQLETLIRDPHHSPANRLTALALLAQGLDKAASASLLALAQALEDGPVLADVLRRIGKHPQLPAAPFLAGKLSSPQPEVRAAAIEALGELGANEGREPLVSLLRDPDSQVRLAAAVAAGKLVAKLATEPLLNLVADGDSAVRRASFDALRLLRAERAVPLAVAALGDREVDLKALECLSELGGPQQAGAVADWAKRNPSADVLVAATRVLSAWWDQPGLTAAKQQELDRAVSEIHGASGILVRWEVSGPVPAQAAPPMIERLAALGPVPDISWQKIFATGAEARVPLAPKDSAKDALWLACTPVTVSEPTAVEFLASSSGSFQVWLNGKLLHRRDEARSFRIDSDRFTATLAQGDNRLLVVVGSSAAAAEFHLHFRRKSATLEHERLTQATLARAGDPARGRQVFLNAEKSLCLKCHRVGDQGERTGPELTGVGNRFSRIYIVESILDPSRSIAPSFATLVVLLGNGQVLSGVKVAETETTITLADNQGQKHILAKADIDEQKPSSLSTMPEGLEKRLSEADFVDLIAFLLNLKQTRLP